MTALVNGLYSRDREAPLFVAASMAPIRVLVISGTTLFRAGIRALAAQAKGIEVVADASTLAEGLQRVDGHSADIMLVDTLDAPELALEALEQIRRTDGAGRVLIVTERGEAESVARMVLAGARGVVFKDSPADQLLTAIRKIHEGELWVDRSTTSQLITGMVDGRHREAAQPEQMKIASLTPREREVIALIATGLHNKAVAARLKISGSTVRHHLTSIFGKLDVPDRLALVLYAFRHSLAAQKA